MRRKGVEEVAGLQGPLDGQSAPMGVVGGHSAAQLRSFPLFGAQVGAYRPLGPTFFQLVPTFSNLFLPFSNVFTKLCPTFPHLFILSPLVPTFPKLVQLVPVTCSYFFLHFLPLPTCSYLFNFPPILVVQLVRTFSNVFHTFPCLSYLFRYLFIHVPYLFISPL